jgi:hypothetical protein
MTQFGNLRAQFGEQQVANALANCVTKDQANAARDFVNSMPIPQCEKDKFLKAIDNWEMQNTQPCCADCQEACDQLYNQLMQTAGQEPLDGGSGSAPASGGAAPATGGSSENGGGDAVSAATSANQSSESEESEGDENWLVALAKAMAEIQKKFLDKAMANKKTMESNADSMDQASDQESTGRGDFLNAQSSFQANMQMFNMMASMTNNMLKTLGQALNTLSSQR